MALLDLINWKKVRRAVLYLICIVLATWLQTMVLSRAAVLGAVPMFLPALAVVIGLFEGGVWGWVLGMAAGFYCDLCCADYAVLFLILFAVFGFGAGLLSEFFINRSFVSYLLLAVAALLITALVQAVPLWLFRGTALWTLLRTALLQTLWSLPFAALLYPVVKLIAVRQRRS